MSVRNPSRPHTARPWAVRLCGAAAAAWRRVCAGPRSERDRYLSQASSHDDLERRMRAWSSFEHHRWLPPR